MKGAACPRKIDRWGFVMVAADEAVNRFVTEFIDGIDRRHVIVTGGYGSGKTHALRVGALSAGAGGGRVAWLDHGAIGLSSFTDLLAAIAGAGGTREVSRREITAADGASGLRRVLDSARPLVIVIEGVDQLFRQLRAADRSAVLAFLHDPDGPLVIGSAVGSSLAPEFAELFHSVATVAVASKSAGIRIALDKAERRRVTLPGEHSRLTRETATVETAFLESPLFWSVLGGHLGAGSREPILRTEADIRALIGTHFDALLLRLAPSEQRVLVEIARTGAPRSVQEIAEAIDVRNQAAASALARLHADGWVDVIDSPHGADRRRTWYDIADPLLRLHLRPRGRGSVGDLIRSVVDHWGDPVDSTLEADAGRFDLTASAALALARGESGEPSVTANWFQDAILRRIEEGGMRSEQTFDASIGWAVWTGEAGDRSTAREMLANLVDDADALFGPGSSRAMDARSAAAWNLVELGEYEPARSIYEELLQTAGVAGERAAVARAHQDLGIALGRHGETRAAVEHLRLAVTDFQLLAAVDTEERQRWWRSTIRRGRHQLAIWVAADGDQETALTIMSELAADATALAHDRHRIAFDAAEIRAAVGKDDAGLEFASLAAEIEAGSLGSGLAQMARLRSLELSSAARPENPLEWPIGSVEPPALAAFVAQLIFSGSLDLEGLADIASTATPAQVRTISARLVGEPGALQPGTRSSLARALAPFLPTESEQRIVADLARALDGDPAGEADLPEEWRSMLAEMSQVDQAGPSGRLET